MKTNPLRLLFGGGDGGDRPVLLRITPPRTGERTMLGVESMLSAVAVPEPFSLELAGGPAASPSWPAACGTGRCAASWPPATPRDASTRSRRRTTPCGWPPESRRG